MRVKNINSIRNKISLTKTQKVIRTISPQKPYIQKPCKQELEMQQKLQESLKRREKINEELQEKLNQLRSEIKSQYIKDYILVIELIMARKAK